MRRHRSQFARPFGRAFRNRSEGASDQRFEPGRIGIADGNHGHQIRAIPVTPEASDRLGRCRFEHRRQANRQPVCIERPLEQHRELFGAHAFAGTESGSPLGEHYAALRDHFLWIERDASRDITQKSKAFLENARAVRWHRQDVHRLVEARIGVQVGAESHADRLEIFHDVVLREILRAVERHVLEKVREAPLIVVLENRTGVHDEAQFGTLLGFGVAAHIIAQAVGQGTGAHGRIARQQRTERERIGRGSSGGFRLRARCSLRDERVRDGDQRDADNEMTHDWASWNGHTLLCVE